MGLELLEYIERYGTRLNPVEEPFLVRRPALNEKLNRNKTTYNSSKLVGVKLCDIHKEWYIRA